MKVRKYAMSKKPYAIPFLLEVSALTGIGSDGKAGKMSSLIVNLFLKRKWQHTITFLLCAFKALFFYSIAISISSTRQLIAAVVTISLPGLFAVCVAWCVICPGGPAKLSC